MKFGKWSNYHSEKFFVVFKLKLIGVEVLNRAFEGPLKWFNAFSASFYPRLVSSHKTDYRVKWWIIKISQRTSGEAPHVLVNHNVPLPLAWKRSSQNNLKCQFWTYTFQIHSFFLFACFLLPICLYLAIAILGNLFLVTLYILYSLTYILQGYCWFNANKAL